MIPWFALLYTKTRAIQYQWTQSACEAQNCTRTCTFWMQVHFHKVNTVCAACVDFPLFQWSNTTSSHPLAPHIPYTKILLFWSILCVDTIPIRDVSVAPPIQAFRISKFKIVGEIHPAVHLSLSLFRLLTYFRSRGTLFVWCWVKTEATDTQRPKGSVEWSWMSSYYWVGSVLLHQIPSVSVQSAVHVLASFFFREKS